MMRVSSSKKASALKLITSSLIQLMVSSLFLKEFQDAKKRVSTPCDTPVLEWRAPEHDFYKVNFDGAFLQSTKARAWA